MTKSLGQFAKLVDVGLISIFCGSKLLIRAGPRRCPRKIRYAFVVSSPLPLLRGSEKVFFVALRGQRRPPLWPLVAPGGPWRDFADRSFWSITRFGRKTPRTGVQTFGSCSILSGLPEMSTEPSGLWSVNMRSIGDGCEDWTRASRYQGDKRVDAHFGMHREGGQSGWGYILGYLMGGPDCAVFQSGWAQSWTAATGEGLFSGSGGRWRRAFVRQGGYRSGGVDLGG